MDEHNTDGNKKKGIDLADRLLLFVAIVVMPALAIGEIIVTGVIKVIPGLYLLVMLGLGIAVAVSKLRERFGLDPIIGRDQVARPPEEEADRDLTTESYDRRMKLSVIGISMAVLVIGVGEIIRTDEVVLLPDALLILMCAGFLTALAIQNVRARRQQNGEQ